MTSRKEDAEKLSKEVEAVKKEMEKVLAPYQRKLEEINAEIKNISIPFYDKVKILEQEFLDKYLIDSNGRTIKKGDIIVNNKIGVTYKVVDRFQQVLFQYLGNPRVLVLKYCNGKIVGKKEWSLFPEDLKNYTIKDEDNESL